MSSGAIIARMFYAELIPNSERFNGLEDGGQITDGKRVAKVRLQLHNNKVVFLIPSWIKSLEGWKKV